jgi:hypothetical protein
MMTGAVSFGIAFCIVVAIIASSRGRNAFGWLLLSIIITPVLSLILLLCIPRVETEEEEKFSKGRYRSKLTR